MEDLPPPQFRRRDVGREVERRVGPSGLAFLSWYVAGAVDKIGMDMESDGVGGGNVSCRGLRTT